MRAVVDTNIFLAGLLNAEGGAANIIHAFRDGEFELVVTREVFNEYVHVVHLFDNAIPAALSEELLELIFEKALKIKPAAGGGLSTDPDDEKFVSAALAEQAAFLVTKNKKHFPKGHSSLKIVSVKEFLREIERVRN
jgi:putative PIN family toxin of toxin-antitoxin system